MGHIPTWFFAIKGLEQVSAQRQPSTEGQISRFQVLGWPNKAEPWLTLPCEVASLSEQRKTEGKAHPDLRPPQLCCADRLHQGMNWILQNLQYVLLSFLTSNSPHLQSDPVCHSFLSALYQLHPCPKELFPAESP